MPNDVAAVRRASACAVLDSCQINPSRDFFTLSPSEVSCLLEWANVWKYRKPKNANGSRGRYFYALLQRRARIAADHPS